MTGKMCERMNQSIYFVLQFLGWFILPITKNMVGVACFLEKKTWDEIFAPYAILKTNRLSIFTGLFHFPIAYHPGLE